MYLLLHDAIPGTEVSASYFDRRWEKKTSSSLARMNFLILAVLCFTASMLDGTAAVPIRNCTDEGKYEVVHVLSTSLQVVNMLLANLMQH